MKNKKVQIRISEDDVKELQDLAQRLDRPAAQIMRDGVRKEIAKLQNGADETIGESVVEKV